MGQWCNNKFDLDRDYHFTNDIKKEDYLKISISSSSFSNLNKAGNIVFQNQQSTNPLDICEAFFYFKIKIIDLAANEDITLENNFFARLFAEMTLKVGTSNVENIANPGETSTMLNFVLTDNSYKTQWGTSSGWVPDVNTGDITDKNPSYGMRKKLYNTGFE